MTIDIEQVSKELKAFVQQFESKWFLGKLSHLIHRPEQLKKVHSPEKQLTYLAALNISSKPTKERTSYTEKEWDIIVEYLNTIQKGYVQLFMPKAGEDTNELWIEKRKVGMSTFFSYFNQGELKYKEQTMYRIIHHCSKFETFIKSKFNLGVQDFIDIGLFLDKLNNEKLNQHLNGFRNFQDFAQEMFEKGIPPSEFKKHMPNEMSSFFEGTHDKGITKRFTEKELSDVFGQEKTKAFLAIFTINRVENDFIYYTGINPILSVPILKDGEYYQFFQDSMIMTAIYNKLKEAIISEDEKKSEAFYKNRGSNLEKKTIEVFQKFYGNDMKVYPKYYTDKGHEQDILVLINHVALIIESKASKVGTPQLDPDKAYDQIENNFNKVIQKGYDQAYRVKEYFIDKQNLIIYDKKKNNSFEIRTKNYYASYSIIVTQERFNELQTDLSSMLEIYDNDDFPYSISIDDLEILLLALSKLFPKKKEKKLVEFLQFREKLHGYVKTSDELEIVAEYLSGNISFQDIKSIKKQGYYLPNPNASLIFDRLYENGGLGFDNELNMDKKNGDYVVI